MGSSIVLFLMLAALANGHVDYNGAQFLRVVPKNEKDITFLQNLVDHYDFHEFTREYAKILAKSDQVSTLKTTLKEAEIEYEVTNHNVGILVQQERLHNEQLRKDGSLKMDWNNYHDYDEIMEWCDQIARDYPDLVTTEDVGQSYEGRVMKIVRITANPYASKKIFVDGGIHAREWIAPATATYVMNELLTKRDKYEDQLNTIQFYFMPVTNPDGYAYSWTNDRMWRKTRSVNNGSPCKGVDGNRNWDFEWMVSGTSSNPCSDTYGGKRAFSEIEMKTTSEQIAGVYGHLYLSYHSYGQLILYPYGYSNTAHAPNEAELIDVGNDVRRAILGVHGKSYTVEQAAGLYPASGASDDWSYARGNYPLSYTIELRGGAYGFQLPASQIIPTGEEQMAGFEVFMNYVGRSSK